MSTLRVRFLGTLDMRVDAQQLSRPPTLKSQSLLAYLIYFRRQPQPRERLADLFWGDRPETKARHSLATALWHIRRCLPDEDLFLSDSQVVQFDPEADIWLDTDEFESEIRSFDVARLELAVALYQGEFLDGFYDDWIINERYRLETLFSDALARLMVGREERGEHAPALSTALRLLHQDPLREDAHRLAMRVYCRLGQRNTALEQYDRCRNTVREELGAEPMVETTELYQTILEGRFEAGRAREVVPAQVPVVELPVPLGRNPLEEMTPSRLVGREAELGRLQQCWQGVKEGRGRLVLISGEAGVGKTRLVEEFASRLRWQGVRVLWGRCYEFERLLPYQPIAGALHTVLPTLPPSELADLPRWTVAEVARLVPEVVEHFPDLEVPASTGSDQEQARFFYAVTRLLSQLSSREALVLVLDDLHWASESTLQMLHHLARHLADHAILLVGTLRSEAVGRQHPLRSLQRRLSREGLAELLHLSRLSSEAVEAMVVEMSGVGETAIPVARRLFRETEGNPFFLAEIVKALFEAKLIYIEESAGPGPRRGAWQGDFARISEGDLPLPASLSEAIQARVDSLNDDAQEALRLAAVLGQEFDFDLLNLLWGRGEEVTLEALDVLLRRRLLDEGSGPTAGDYVFTHNKIQEVVYAGMPRQRRQHAHARAGVAMESLYGTAEREALAGELAYHFEQGRKLDQTLTDKAITYLHQAGERAAKQFANEEALRYLGRALDLTRETDLATRYALLCVRERVYDLKGARDAQRQDLATLERLAEALDDGGQEATLRRSAVALRQAQFGEVTGDYPAAIEAARAVVGWARRVQDDKEEAAGYLVWGRTLWQQGEREVAQSKLKRAMELARKAGSRQMQAESLGALGNVAYGLSDYPEASGHWEQALALYREAGDRLGESATLNKLGMVFWSQSAYPEAKAHYEQALLIHRETGDRFGEGNVLGNLGIVSAESGDYAAARVFYEGALTVRREIDDRLGESNALNSLGWLCESQGHFREARDFSQQALVISREIGDRRGEGWALLNLGRVCHRVGDTAPALSHLEGALQIYREVGYRRYEGLLLLNLSFVRYDRGEYSRASACLEQALEVFRATGSRQFEGWALNHKGVLSATFGEYAQAKACYDEAQTIFQEIDDLRSEGRGLTNLALLSHHRGDDDAAYQHGQRALEIARKVGDRPLESDALTNLGHALASLGRFPEAADAYRQALDIRQGLNQPNIAMQPLAGLARVCLAQRDLTQAMACVQGILEHVKTRSASSGVSERTGHALEGTDEPLRIYWSCYRVLRAKGDPRAQAVLETAHGLLQERAANIDDEERRRSFLQHVRTHREIVREFNIGRG